jgi:hypothetical protein
MALSFLVPVVPTYGSAGKDFSKSITTMHRISMLKTSNSSYKQYSFYNSQISFIKLILMVYLFSDINVALLLFLKVFKTPKFIERRISTFSTEADEQSELHLLRRRF